MNTVPSITASVASVSIVTTVALLLQGFVQDFFPGGGGGGGGGGIQLMVIWRA